MDGSTALPGAGWLAVFVSQGKERCSLERGMSSLLIATNTVTADCHSQPCVVSGDRPASMFCTEASFVQKWQSSSRKEGGGVALLSDRLLFSLGFLPRTGRSRRLVSLVVKLSVRDMVD